MTPDLILGEGLNSKSDLRRSSESANSKVNLSDARPLDRSIQVDDYVHVGKELVGRHLLEGDWRALPGRLLAFKDQTNFKLVKISCLLAISFEAKNQAHAHYCGQMRRLEI